MSTLNELIYYCNETDPIGALMLTGEWGCGKTYLIEKELTRALEDTHVIVRISLFGVDNIKAIHQAVRQKWIEACMPILGSLERARDKGFFSAFNSVLKRFSPVAGSAADVMVSMNVVDLVVIKPEIEDFITHKKKRVVLVYDDLERAGMSTLEIMGVINEYCENQNFNTIIAFNEELLREEWEREKLTYHMLKEKTVAQTVYHVPDYSAVIHNILESEEWQTPDYAEYLKEHEELIKEVFMPDPKRPERVFLMKQDRKYHNFRTLIKSLQTFYRIYSYLTERGIEVTDDHLYSFIAYYLVSKCGICRNGMPCIDFTDDDIKEFYPKYSPDSIKDSERRWINIGIWDKNMDK